MILLGSKFVCFPDCLVSGPEDVWYYIKLLLVSLLLALVRFSEDVLAIVGKLSSIGLSSVFKRGFGTSLFSLLVILLAY